MAKPTLLLIVASNYIGAQRQYKILSFFPFYAYTLRFLVPRCCRVSLQPGLSGQNSISFSGLHDAGTPVPKPDWSEHEVQRSKA